MTTKSESPALNGASTGANQNQCLVESSTGLVPPQTRVIAVGALRAALIRYLWTRRDAGCSNDEYHLSHEGEDTVLIFGRRGIDYPDEIGLEVTFVGWHPICRIPALNLCAELVEAGWTAECTKSLARLGSRKGKTILTSTHPRELMQYLRELSTAIDKLHDKIQDQRYWLPIPEGVVVSVRWWPVLPAEVSE